MASHSSFATKKELYKDDRLGASEKFMHEGLLKAFDKTRLELGHRLTITSGRRSQETQEILKKIGKRAATTSTHTVGAALDILVPGYLKDYQLAEMLKKHVKDTCGILPRLGYMSYRDHITPSSFWVHVDVGPIFFEAYPGKFPEAWRVEGLIF